MTPTGKIPTWLTNYMHAPAPKPKRVESEGIYGIPLGVQSLGNGKPDIIPSKKTVQQSVNENLTGPNSSQSMALLRKGRLSGHVSKGPSLRLAPIDGNTGKNGTVAGVPAKGNPTRAAGKGQPNHKPPVPKPSISYADMNRSVRFGKS